VGITARKPPCGVASGDDVEAIPKTPAYQLAGKLDVDGLDKIRFSDFQGRLGNSDIGGTIEEQPNGTEVKGKTKPVVTMDLRSNRVDLADLNGFIGGTLGQSNTANATAQEREAAAKANASSKLRPERCPRRGGRAHNRASDQLWRG
jgi:hypothetical protein